MCKPFIRSPAIERIQRAALSVPLDNRVIREGFALTTPESGAGHAPIQCDWQRVT